MARRTFHTDTPLQALLVEHALLLARQLEAAADAAPDGQVLSAVEAAALPAGRELTRKAVEAALQRPAPAVEKRGRRAATARTAGTPRATKDAPDEPS